MQLFMPSIDAGAASRLQDLLHSRGIPVHVAEVETGLDWNWQQRASHRSLWICEPDQFDDALALVRDPDHVVREPRDIEAYLAAAAAALDDAGEPAFEPMLDPVVSRPDARPLMVFLIGLLTAAILGIAASAVLP